VGWRIVIDADDAGAGYKEILRELLQNDSRVDEVIDGGGGSADDPYPNVAVRAANLVASGEADRGVLICGTGLGVAIAANKVRGIRAVTAHDSYSIERAILSNNAQVLGLGARVIGVEVAKRLVSEWLGYRFDDASPSAAKVELISRHEASSVDGEDQR